MKCFLVAINLINIMKNVNRQENKRNLNVVEYGMRSSRCDSYNFALGCVSFGAFKGFYDHEMENIILW